MKRVPLALPLLLALWGVAMLVGCVVLPSASSRLDDHGHAWVKTREDRNVKSGVATKEAVLDVLGRPDVTMADGRLLAYTWTTGKGVHFTYTPVTCFHSPESRTDTRSIMREQTNYLLLEFGDDGTLRRKRLRQGGQINVYAKGIDDAIQ